MSSDLFSGISLALLLGVALYFLVSKLTKKENSANSNDEILKLKIQAYERIILFLSRIKPESLIDRSLPQYEDSQDLKLALLSDIKAEFNHNVTQQLFLKQETWNQVVYATEFIKSEILKNTEVDMKQFKIGILTIPIETINVALNNLKKDFQELN